MGEPRPIGSITRGTTAPNRLRRCDRWLVGPQAWRLRRPAGPVRVVDLGYGASAVTTVELARRLRGLRPDVEVIGLEIDPERVARAQPHAGPGLSFRRGGFELGGLAAEGPVHLIRAFNVLRQYDENEVPVTWRRLRSALAPDGLLVDGTCDELGRVASWVSVTPAGPVSLTLALRLAGLDDPAVLAERLPKCLIHRNVPGEPVHDFVAALTQAWTREAPLAAYGTRDRFVAAVGRLREQGWPLLDRRDRWRLGEVTVAWAAVAPQAQAGESSARA